MKGRPVPIQRYKLTVAYRGTAYHGWQFQQPSATWKKPIPPTDVGIPTVQSHLRLALRHVVRHDVTVVGSSRTDAGVHAKGQVCHFDTDKGQIPTEALRRSANYQLPDDIVIRSVEPVGPGFDAIASTVTKRYQYAIWNDIDRHPMLAGLAWHRWQPLDVDAMAEAAGRFVGTHDFTTFCRPGHGRATTVRTVHACSVSHRSPRVVVAAEGGGFLWHMVRIIVGTLVEVGLGRHRPETITDMIAARDRRAAGGTAPPHGLYLQWVRTADPSQLAPGSARDSPADGHGGEEPPAEPGPNGSE